MKVKSVLFSYAFIGFVVSAEAQMTNTDAFEAGKQFGTNGINGAHDTVSNTTGQSNVPKYNADAPEGTLYQSGKGAVGTFGTAKQGTCQTYKADNAYDQQECDAVNFLTQSPSTRPKYQIDKSKDPLIINANKVISTPGDVPGSDTQQCHTVNVTTPGTTKEETCDISEVYAANACTKVLVPQCDYNGSPISAYTTNKTGAFITSSLIATSTPGAYNYILEVPYRNCGGNGTAEIDFNLDTVDGSGNLTMDLSNLDDAAAVAVNGITVFAGYPNNGPSYSGAAFFPQDTASFQVGYSWSETVQQCVQTSGRSCTKYDPVVQQFTADVKLLDFCPNGYAITPMQFNQFYPGFFCNVEGKFLMNRHEGDGTWGGSVSSQMPLKVGTNKIVVYWGTAPNGDSCGNVTVKGQIFNMQPSCSEVWNDGCAKMRAAQ